MNAAQTLREWGFQLTVLDDDRIEIVQFSKLDDELKQWIIRNKPALIADIKAADAVDAEILCKPNKELIQ